MVANLLNVSQNQNQNLNKASIHTTAAFIRRPAGQATARPKVTSGRRTPPQLSAPVQYRGHISHDNEPPPPPPPPPASDDEEPPKASPTDPGARSGPGRSSTQSNQTQGEGREREGGKRGPACPPHLDTGAARFAAPPAGHATGKREREREGKYAARGERNFFFRAVVAVGGRRSRVRVVVRRAALGLGLGGAKSFLLFFLFFAREKLR